MTDESKKPSKQEQVRRNHLFSTAAGKAAWDDAMGGDIHTLRCHLTSIVVRIERGQALEPHERKWLGDALMDMAFGIDPNIAFGFKKGRGGQARPKMWERWVAFEMCSLILEGKAKKEAAGLVKQKALDEFASGGSLSYFLTAKEINLSIDSYETIYDTYESWAREAWGSRVHRSE